MKIVKNIEVISLQNFSEKLIGLLNMRPNKNTYAFHGCNSVHTYGMKHKLDIAFIDEHGCVIQVCRNVPAGLKIKCKKAEITLERFSEMHTDLFVDKSDYVRLVPKQRSYSLTI